ncbi:hypothetical protein [Pseudomonas sp. PA27(2017)]|uniref:hypothetical protein n=1 Tax=Pseudomonas sp. PA27(2017) TaxID=1932112 RepID=UPI000960F084|nr:hypothetical protein [Pseudomonas sp. PA27(2017)]OLU23887.1 hypothetical protein BVH06_22185 [Pseudomonas sp. PA27(2017)]
MRKVFLYGKFFADWAGTLEELADFAGVSVSRLSYDVADTKAQAIKRLNEDFAAAMAALHDGWPDYEIQTWTVQAEEARQWMAAKADAKPVVPFLSSLHTQREAMGWEGTLENLVERVLQNTNAYTAATASLIGRRHVAERAIDAAEDPSSITWDFVFSAPTEG